MKDYINRLARGNFIYQLPQLVLPKVKLEEKVTLDTNQEFQVEVNGSDQIKGLIYSSNERVTLLENCFSGKNNLLTFHVNAMGCNSGDEIEGAFSIVSSAGESSVPFLFQVEEPVCTTSVGNAGNLYEFAGLVENSPKEAEKLFLSDQFAEVFLGEDAALRNLYDLLKKTDNTQQAIEEFLIAGKKKAPISIEISETLKKYTEMTENQNDFIVITKGSWGYLNLQISCDCDFITLSKTTLTQEDFTGNKCELEYVVEYDRLHKGNNYGRITLRTFQQELTLEVKASSVALRQANYEKKKALYQLTREYLDFRLKKNDLSQWIANSNQVVERIRANDQDDVYFKLVQAQMYFTDKRLEEGQVLLDSVKDAIFENIDCNVELYCYYLYVNSLAIRQEEYTTQVVKIINHYFENGHDNYRMLWLLFYLDAGQYSNKSIKLARIKDICREGCISPIMYLEALSIMNSQPVLLRVLNEFEYQVILFGCKNQMITKDLAMQICQIIQNEKVANAKYLRILNALYQMYEEDDILTVLVTHMIRNELTGEQYLALYEKGILRGLRITRLYEFYMMSLNHNDMKRLPKMVLMYFIYDSELEYQSKAYLYANIIANRDIMPEVIQNYQPQIEKFAYEQIRLGHITPCLEHIYKFVWNDQMVNAETAEFMSRYLFTYKIKCYDADIVRVYVKQKELSTCNSYPVINKIAYVPVYTDYCAFCFEYADGSIGRGSVQYEIERLCNDLSTLEALKEFCNDDLYLGIYLYEESKKNGYKDELTASNCRKLMNHSFVTDQVKNEMNAWLIQYYYENYTGDAFRDRYKELKKTHLNAINATQLIEVCITNGMYEDAFELIGQYGYQRVQPERLFRLVSHLLGIDAYRSDSLMISLCTAAFEEEQYEKEVLAYLVMYYNGTNEQMYAVWKAANNFEVNSDQIAERIVAQMLFTGELNGRLTEVFRAYYLAGGDPVLVEAYAAYQSFQYFIKHKNSNQIVFEVLEHNLKKDFYKPDVCKLALLKHYSQQNNLEEEQYQLASLILEEMCKQNKLFAFYRQFRTAIELPYNIIDKTIVEYYGAPDAKVIVHYCMAGEKKEHSEILKCIAGGAYTKVFTLFTGENLQYYFTEEYNGNIVESEHASISYGHNTGNSMNGRFDYLNEMLASREMHDIATLKKTMHEYCVNNYLSEQIFKPM